MPAPANDNIASAQAIGGYSGHVDGSNVGATSQAGESGGKTVWYAWLVPDTITADFRFWTRTPGPGSNFNTVLSVYRSTLSPPTPITIASLILVATNDNYSSWDRASEVVFNTIDAGTYYIQVSGTGGAGFDEGSFRLSWERFALVTLGDCNKCPLQPTPYEICKGVFTIDPMGVGTYSWGPQLPGQYIVRYCGGAWKYNNVPNLNQYVVTRIPVAADQTWPEQISSGWFLHVIYFGTDGSAVVLHFDEPPISGGARDFGYQTENEARLAMRCREILIKNPTNREIKLFFTDKQYDDNSHAVHDLQIALYRITTAFLFVQTLFDFWDGSAFEVDFSIKNTTKYNSGFINFELVASGGIVSPVVNGPMPLAFAPFEAKDVKFKYNVSPVGKTDCIATIRPTESSGPDLIRYDDIVIDLTPVITTRLIGVGVVESCGPTARRVNVGVKNRGNGPTWALVATAQNPTGCQIISDSSCAVVATLVKTVGMLDPTIEVILEIRVTGASGSCSFDIAYQDGPLTHPVARVTFSG